jgi:serine/threonine protein kinase
VKPGNMLLAGSARVYLADFGVSRHILADRLTAVGHIVGTLDYVSPEQIDGRRVDGRADQYSLACAAFELLGGVPPFRRSQAPAIIYAQLTDPPPPLAATRPEIPAAVDAVLAKALAKHPSNRFSTCSQFAANLAHALGIDPAASGQRTGPAPHAPPTRLVGGEPPTRRREP